MNLEILNKTILLVEDDKAIVRMLARRLKKAGYNLYVAENGQSGHLQILSICPDLVLMDLHMPVMDGIEATRKLRADGYTGLICALTASATGDDIKKSMQAGCDYFIAKPIGIDFEDCIQDMLGETS